MAIRGLASPIAVDDEHALQQQARQEEANPTYGGRLDKHIEVATHQPCGTTRVS
jgi:hypothetical protein